MGRVIKEKAISYLRFYKGEQENDKKFAYQLASLGEEFVNDAFSCSHRNHASISSLAGELPSAAGFAFVKELSQIELLLSMPSRPFVAIIGGSKISTKITLIKALMKKADRVIIAGLMANTFLRARGVNIGSSAFDNHLVDEARSIASNEKIILPEDFITKPVNGGVRLDVGDSDEIFDIGPSTCRTISEIISNAKTVIWNGPLGAFETKPFDTGTRFIANHIAHMSHFHGLISVVGGGDTLAAVRETGLLNYFTYASTGGGAFLKWLEGSGLPGVDALK